MPTMLETAKKNLFTGNDQGWSPRTISMYRVHLDQFEEYFGPDFILEEMTEKKLMAWRENFGYTDSTFSAKMRAVRALYRHNNIEFGDFFNSIAPTVEEKQTLALDELKLSELFAFDPGSSYVQIRGKAACALVANGVRPDQLELLDYDDLYFDYMLISSPVADKLLPIVYPHTANYLLDYMHVRKQRGEERSFLTTVWGKRPRTAVHYANGFIELALPNGNYTSRSLYAKYILDVSTDCQFNLDCVSVVTGLSPRRIQPILIANGYKDFIKWSSKNAIG